jgi:hypothetical protein
MFTSSGCVRISAADTAHAPTRAYFFQILLSKRISVITAAMLESPRNLIALNIYSFLLFATIDLVRKYLEIRLQKTRFNTGFNQFFCTAFGKCHRT